MIRQTDNIRITERCNRPTYYPMDDGKRFVKPHCEYLKDGKCELNYCIRKETNDRLRNIR